MVFQNFALFPHLTALENIILAPMKVRKLNKRESEDRAMQLLRKVGVSERAKRISVLAFWRSTAASNHSTCNWQCNPRSCSLMNLRLHLTPK